MDYSLLSALLPTTRHKGMFFTTTFQMFAQVFTKNTPLRAKKMPKRTQNGAHSRDKPRMPKTWLLHKPNFTSYMRLQRLLAHSGTSTHNKCELQSHMVNVY